MHGVQVMAHSYLRGDVNSQMRILLNILSFYDAFIHDIMMLYIRASKENKKRRSSFRTKTVNKAGNVLNNYRL